MANDRTVAAIIAATLVAHGKTARADIAKAVEVYRDCLNELERRLPTSGYPPTTPEQQ